MTRIVYFSLLIVLLTACGSGASSENSSGQQLAQITNSILGVWQMTFSDGCVETLTFSDDGNHALSSREEVSGGTYSFENTSEIGSRHKLTFNVTYDNAGKDCEGDVTDYTGSTLISYAEFVSSENIYFYVTRNSSEVIADFYLLASPDSVGISVSPGSRDNLVTWNNLEGAISYNLYAKRYTGGGSVTESIRNITENSYLHSDLVNNTTYYYEIRPVYSDGVERRPGGSASGTPRANTGVPVAGFVFKCLVDECEFDASSSSDVDGDIVSYSWVFGDGASGEGQMVDHDYIRDALFNVTLIVTDAEGLTDQITKNIPIEKYTKISGFGLELPGAASKWSCVSDNSTGLMWEVKTDDGLLQDQRWRYMNTSNMDNGDPRDSSDNGDCYASQSSYDGIFCDSESYVDAVNAISLCGYSDWRVPDIDEINKLVFCKDSVNSYPVEGYPCEGIVVPTIRKEYFPVALGVFMLTSTSDGDSNMWAVNFGWGFWENNHRRTDDLSIRLVR